jgi:hypothetical protein
MNVSCKQNRTDHTRPNSRRSRRREWWGGWEAVYLGWWAWTKTRSAARRVLLSAHPWDVTWYSRVRTGGRCPRTGTPARSRADRSGGPGQCANSELPSSSTSSFLAQDHLDISCTIEKGISCNSNYLFVNPMRDQSVVSIARRRA